MSFPRTLAYRLQRHAKTGIDAALGSLAVAMLRMIRATNRKHMADFAGGFMRTLGPRLKEHRIGRDNLAAAFPDKTPEEIEQILRGVWDNLGRVAAEFAHVDRLCEGDPEDRVFIDYTHGTAERFKRLRDHGKGALIFAGHLANWELPALLAAADGLNTLVLYRRPNLQAVADVIVGVREKHMGEMVPTSLGAPMRLARGL